jgi:hypothetical protein
LAAKLEQHPKQEQPEQERLQQPEHPQVRRQHPRQFKQFG